MRLPLFVAILLFSTTIAVLMAAETDRVGFSERLSNEGPIDPRCQQNTAGLVGNHLRQREGRVGQRPREPPVSEWLRDRHGMCATAEGRIGRIAARCRWSLAQRR